MGAWENTIGSIFYSAHLQMSSSYRSYLLKDERQALASTPQQPLRTYLVHATAVNGPEAQISLGF